MDEADDWLGILTSPWFGMGAKEFSMVSRMTESLERMICLLHTRLDLRPRDRGESNMDAS